ncbi:MAG: VWA domain-containing protein [Rhodobacteraceae bacterium]|nr:VWA domain-containing protein [Paracoccaceae bacterium]
MSRVTRFAARDPGPAARMAGFMAHLRDGGLRLGVQQTKMALCALTHLDASSPRLARAALRAVCTGCHDEVRRFDALFDAYWMNMGRVRQKVVPKSDSPTGSDSVRTSRRTAEIDQRSPGHLTSPDDGQEESAGDGQGQLSATAARNLHQCDLRDLVDAADIAEAEAVARRLGSALRDRLSRRRVASRKGMGLHFRRTIRRNLATGGEPIHLIRKFRPERERFIVTLCDVSGSMQVYARVFLAFIAGLMRANPAADSYLFHTRLVRVTEALRDKDAMRAIGRMSLMADGFGGGTKIGECLGHFARTYARSLVNGRTVVIVFSDGFDTSPPAILEAALAKLRKRGCRIVWLNPLRGWQDYQPVAAGMAAALPSLDLFAPANTLDDLAALERRLVRL